jgi:hypothetical protein
MMSTLLLEECYVYACTLTYWSKVQECKHYTVFKGQVLKAYETYTVFQINDSSNSR